MNKVEKNKHAIGSNRMAIHENRVAIDELRSRCNVRCVPYDVFSEAVGKYDGVVRRLVIVVCVVVALLFITNSLWLYAWASGELGRSSVSVVNDGGSTSVVGGDGGIGDGK